VERTRFDLRVVEVASGRLHWLTQGLYQDLHPAWSPSGRWIYFSSYRSGGINLWRVPVTREGEPTGPPEPVTHGPGQDVEATISPDGTRLAFSILRQNASLWKLPVSPADGHAAGPPEKVIATTREASRGAWSPDGARIAFNSDRSGDMNLWV